MTDLVDCSKDIPATRFRLMADMIEHNSANSFGGAVVIVPPAEGGEPIEILILDIKADPAQFWSTIDTRIKIRLAELDEKQRGQQAFGRQGIR